MSIIEERARQKICDHTQNMSYLLGCKEAERPETCVSDAGFFFNVSWI